MGSEPVKITPDRFDAALFDLDGVLTRTATVHATAWRSMFDEFLERRSKGEHEAFVPFSLPDDYIQHVDGKPRYDGVRHFLASRDITLPEGDPTDPPETVTVCGLGNRKDALFNRVLATEGVEVFAGSVRLLEAVRAAGIKTAVVSSSKNCTTIVESAGLSDQFDASVDGHAVEDGGLQGKPAPDTYLEAARQLGVDPARAVVFEDALSGVEAGRNGHFGLVVGVDRADQAEALLEHGADIVVTDLATLIP
jgi:beta-phosphoglucomutase family hydrolase